MTSATLLREKPSTESLDCREEWADWHDVDASWQQGESLADLIDKDEIELSQQEAINFTAIMRNKTAKLKITPKPLPSSGTK